VHRLFDRGAVALGEHDLKRPIDRDFLDMVDQHGLLDRRRRRVNEVGRNGALHVARRHGRSGEAGKHDQ
jgi:hypothetical protein